MRSANSYSQSAMAVCRAMPEMEACSRCKSASDDPEIVVIQAMQANCPNPLGESLPGQCRPSALITPVG